MFKDKTTLFIIIASLLGVLLVVLVSFICYHFTTNRRKLKYLQSSPYTGSKEILEYDSLRFTYDTNIETQQTNFPAELAYQNLQRNVAGDGSASSASSFDETDRVNLFKNVDLVQPFTGSSKSSSECSELVDVLLVDNTKNVANDPSYLTECGLGRLSAALFFDKTLGILRVNIIQWNNSGAKNTRSTLSPYVKVQLFPDLERKFFTKTKRGESPVFDEEFAFPVTESGLKEKSLHLSVCDFDKFSRQNILGNGVIKLEEFLDKVTLPEGTGEVWMNLTESNGITSSEYKGEISFSLSYYPTSSRVTLTVVKAKDLNVDDNDTRIAVKVSLLFGGKVARSRKTTYHHSDMINPIFNESWVFDIPSDALEQTSFLLCVYAYIHNKKRIIGTATTGSQVRSKTGLAQWNEMLLQRRDRILHSHKLE